MTVKLTEEQWQRQVIELAQRYGWLVAHFRPARTERGWRTPVEADGAGFPDLVLVRGPRLIFAELKSDTGRLSVSQSRWQARLSEVAAAVAAVRSVAIDTHPSPPAELVDVTVDAYVWRPRDFPAVHDALRPV